MYLLMVRYTPQGIALVRQGMFLYKIVNNALELKDSFEPFGTTSTRYLVNHMVLSGDNLYWFISYNTTGNSDGNVGESYVVCIDDTCKFKVLKSFSMLVERSGVDKDGFLWYDPVGAVRGNFERYNPFNTVDVSISCERRSYVYDDIIETWCDVNVVDLDNNPCAYVLKLRGSTNVKFSNNENNIVVTVDNTGVARVPFEIIYPTPISLIATNLD